MLIDGLEQIADLFGVAPKTISQWQQQGMPVAIRGSFSRTATASQYNAGACIRWLTDREVAKVRVESQGDRLKRVQADAVELQLAELRRQLVPIALIEPRMQAALAFARSAWRGEPARLARSLADKTPDEVESLLQEAADAFLKRLSIWPTAAHASP